MYLYAVALLAEALDFTACFLKEASEIRNSKAKYYSSWYNPSRHDESMIAHIASKLELST